MPTTVWEPEVKTPEVKTPAPEVSVAAAVENSGNIADQAKTPPPEPATAETVSPDNSQVPASAEAPRPCTDGTEREAHRHGTRTRTAITRRPQAADKALQRNTEERLLGETGGGDCATNERRGLRCCEEKGEQTTGERS